MKKLTLAMLAALVALSMVACGDSGVYGRAAREFDEQNYAEAIKLLDSIPDYEDSDNLRERAYAAEFRAIVEATTSPVCCEVASDGSYLKADTNPRDEEDFFDMNYVQTIKDINKALGFPESLWEKMGQTRSLDGRQSSENDKYAAEWSYHPDNGLEVLYERK